VVHPLPTVPTLTLALSKGRIFDETLPLLAAAGIVPAEDPETSRKLIVGTNRPGVSVLIVRATDVPTYVAHGAADIGVAGKDVLLEQGGEGLYQPLDLEIARCRMVVATRRGFDWAGTVQRGARIRVATKYVEIAREHFAAKGMHVDLIKLYGSMELAPLSGLADAIVDLVSSGRTLLANDLVVVEDILPISARLIVNPAALKLKRGVVQPLLDAMVKAVAARRSVASAGATHERARPILRAARRRRAGLPTAICRQARRPSRCRRRIPRSMRRSRGSSRTSGARRPALLEYTAEFDALPRCRWRRSRSPQARCGAPGRRCSRRRAAPVMAAQRIRAYHERQKQASWSTADSDGSNTAARDAARPGRHPVPAAGRRYPRRC
jgi:ATP phosphoribosyltransferase